MARPDRKKNIARGDAKRPQDPLSAVIYPCYANTQCILDWTASTDLCVRLILQAGAWAGARARVTAGYLLGVAALDGLFAGAPDDGGQRTAAKRARDGGRVALLGGAVTARGQLRTHCREEAGDIASAGDRGTPSTGQLRIHCRERGGIYTISWGQRDAGHGTDCQGHLSTPPSDGRLGRLGNANTSCDRRIVTMTSNQTAALLTSKLPDKKKNDIRATVAPHPVRFMTNRETYFIRTVQRIHYLAYLTDQPRRLALVS